MLFMLLMLLFLSIDFILQKMITFCKIGQQSAPIQSYTHSEGISRSRARFLTFVGIFLTFGRIYRITRQKKPNCFENRNSSAGMLWVICTGISPAARISALAAGKCPAGASRFPTASRRMRTQSCAERTKAPGHTGISPAARIRALSAWRMSCCASRSPIYKRRMRTQSCAERTKWVRDGSPKRGWSSKCYSILFLVTRTGIEPMLPP